MWQIYTNINKDRVIVKIKSSLLYNGTLLFLI